MNWLILGGTTEARLFTEQACAEIVRGDLSLGNHGTEPTLIYSVAGRVRQPQLPCRVISGGFSAGGGLQRYLQVEAIQGILDFTHPFAARISTAAVAAARAQGIPCWRFRRPPWRARAGDRWQCFSTRDDLWQALGHFKSILLTLGQLTPAEWEALLSVVTPGQGQRLVIRTAVAPGMTLPEGVEWLQAIGPFCLEDEIRLLTNAQIDVLVTKNSGGQATQAKLNAARQLQVPVLMLDRPVLPPADHEFETIEQGLNDLKHYLTQTEHAGYPDVF
ncbi:MAG: precorrin-6A/cobalt-precorrin-6A reductase [Hahellaceae bacterium]|nr:precorrin-6A/cobalt-precorrin-6A reductase [Hahellaceae bacterium]MCP5170160.1 precorrin-6A/cobalt-precorrin-6A reductase [Hahellaceae bacterium]